LIANGDFIDVIVAVAIAGVVVQRVVDGRGGTQEVGPLDGAAILGNVLPAARTRAPFAQSELTEQVEVGREDVGPGNAEGRFYGD
jgi:hypothetical protein